MFRLITEVLSLISSQLDNSLEHLGKKVWTIFFGIGVALGSVLLLFLGIAFIGFSIYQALVVAVGAVYAALIVGGFFILIALILLLISKNMIKKK